MISKSVIRAAMLARRKQLALAEQATCGRVIQNTFLGLAVYEQAASIVLYQPVNGEVPTDEILKHALAAGKLIYLPVIHNDEIVLRQYSQFDKLKAGRFGILEPPGESLIAHPQHIDVFVVPGVVFDQSCNRGGYGKGYYDRLLQSCCKNSTLIGFCYDFQVVDAIAAESHDVGMDMVITERRVISSYC
jgi:5-formyltetrahydrofolate cyclo-ligase